MNIQAGKGGPRPRMLMCYLCGREFGSKSLPIHLPQCQKKWMEAEQLKPSKDQRPMPQPPAPEAPIKLGGASAQAIDDFNEAAYEQFQASLEKCHFCDRKFSPEAYKHHQRSCTAHSPAKPAGTALTSSSLSNNKRMQPYSLIRCGSKQSSPKANEHPRVALQQRQQDLRRKIAEARAQQVASSGPSGVKQQTASASRSKSAKISSAKVVEHGTSPTHKSGFCGECGAAYAPDAKFCSTCGTKR